jgi:transcriptional regulator with XRE-family HTH domain
MGIDDYIGRRIRRRRHLLQLTQKDLAARIGTSHQAVFKIEIGQTRVSAARLYDIACALDLPIGYFVDGYEPGWSNTSRKDATPDAREEF